MYHDPGIICYQHCQKTTKVFTFVLPEFCNFCKADLSDTELRIPPFRIPYPFKDATREPNAVVIKPTTGDFLNNYGNSSNLHIGVTDSTGFVFEYDCNGGTKSYGKFWDQCLVINILDKMNSSLKCYWDAILNDVFKQKCWAAERYDADSHNCYSFVLTFLKFLELEELHPYVTDKTTFCQHFISPQARIAAKYIGLYRQLKIQNIVIQ